MALVLQDPKSGSIGSITNSRGRSGQIIRQRAMPTNPNTAAQAAARARLANMSAGWRGLTDAQRAAWNAFAASFSITNALGASINLTGHQAYVKINTVNLLNGIAAVTAPPALPAFGSLAATALTGLLATPALSITSTLATGQTSIMVFASGQKSAGVSYVNDFRYLATFTQATTGKLDILAAYVAKFGALIGGKKIFVKCFQVQAGFQDNGTVFVWTVA